MRALAGAALATLILVFGTGCGTGGPAKGGDANQKLTELYGGIESSYSRATTLYQQVARVEKDDVLLQNLLATSAYQSRRNGIAIKAAQRVCTLAPGSPDCTQARNLIAQIRAQSVQTAPSSG